MIKIGIDPGTHTGFAVWHTGKKLFYTVQTVPIHTALEYVKTWKENCLSDELEIICEDARHLGGSSVKAQGAGSIKRDCSIWEDFCKDYNIPIRFVRPSKRSVLKCDPEWFKQQTGWKERTSQHSRDAAMLVYGM